MEIKKLLAYAVENKASDLHLSAGVSPLLRVNGKLIPIKEIAPITADNLQKELLTLLNAGQQEEFKNSLQIDFAMALDNLAAFRVNAFNQNNGLAAVFRIIPTNIPSLDELGTPPILKKILTLSSGLILVTGPTGCGKSTTLASMVNYINLNKACHIITIEDPIEFVHISNKSLINQRQVYRDAKSFSSALKAALREDPDVILVGELRDLTSIRLALTAAETGHLVMATLHTRSAAQAISRMIDVFPTSEKNIIRNMISESLKAVICQTLVKKIAGGRAAAFEVMLATNAIRNLIREDRITQMESVIQTSSNKGMCTLEQSLNALLTKNIIDSAAASESKSQREIFEEG